MQKLKVLFINSIQMWGGAEVWLMDVMHGLEGRGHDVTLVCRPGTILEKNARAEGFDVVAMKMRGDVDPFVIYNVMHVMKSKGIQVMSTNMDKELRFGGLAAKLAGDVVVIPSREVDYPLKNNLRYRLTYNWLADYVLANSESTKQTLLSSAPWLDEDRIEVVYKGINPTPYMERPEDGAALRDELGIASDTKVVGFVGQIIERKGVPDIIEAIPLVVEKIPNVRFLFVGEGLLDDFVVEAAKERGVADNVIHAGFRKDIPAIMKAVDLLILPSVVEGFGYVLAEAMAASRPVVATRASSIPEIVVHDETGLLVDVHEPEQLADAVARILGDDTLATDMGRRGRERVLANFTLERMVAHIEEVFVRKVYG